MPTMDRRSFLGTSLGGMALALEAGSGARALAQQPEPAGAAALPATPDTLFLTWQRDPTTTMTVQWIGGPLKSGAETIQFAALGREEWKATTPNQRPYPMTELSAYRAEMIGLTPGTEYQFRFGSQSPTYRFRTMPAKATDSFHFISGGDCGVNPHAIANNKIAAKQDPMFALIGGDLGYDNGKNSEISLQFVRNYSQNMIDSKGRMIPMVVCIGNHEVATGYNGTRKDAPFYFALHDGLYAERSYATLDFGDYLSLVLLDTGHIAPIGGEQADWLDKALKERLDRPHLIAVNHVPAYPSFRAFESNGEKVGTGEENRKFWSPLFEKYNVDLVLEHHDHTFKRTHPLKDGHVDPNGIVYLGDGSWGMLRVPKKPEERPYLAHTEEAYHLTLHRLEGAQNFHTAIDENGRIIDICRTTKKPRGRSVG